MSYGREATALPTLGVRVGRDGGARSEDGDTPVEAIEEAVALLGRRRRVGILCLLARGRYRYNAMMRELPGATPKMLTQQLRALEEEGLVARHELTGGGKHTEYELTTAGEHFLPVVEAFNGWVRQHWRRATDAPAYRASQGGAGARWGGVARPRAD